MPPEVLPAQHQRTASPSGDEILVDAKASVTRGATCYVLLSCNETRNVGRKPAEYIQLTHIHQEHELNTRLRYFVELMREPGRKENAHKIVVTGNACLSAKHLGYPSDAAYMKEYLESQGLKNIVKEGKATDTVDNIFNTLYILFHRPNFLQNLSKIVFVSSSYHLPRIRRITDTLFPKNSRGLIECEYQGPVVKYDARQRVEKRCMKHWTHFFGSRLDQRVQYLQQLVSQSSLLRSILSRKPDTDGHESRTTSSENAANDVR